MTWHTVVAAKEELQVLLGTIRGAGGIITRSCPCPAGFLLTYVTPGG
jgi:hypothetical protein